MFNFQEWTWKQKDSEKNHNIFRECKTLQNIWALNESFHPNFVEKHENSTI